MGYASKKQQHCYSNKTLIFWQNFDINFAHNFTAWTMCLFDWNALAKCVVKGFIAHKWNHSENKSNNLMVKFTTRHFGWPIFRMETFNKISNLFNEWQRTENGKWHKGNIDGGIAFKKNPLNNEIIRNEFVLAPFDWIIY